MPHAISFPLVRAGNADNFNTCGTATLLNGAAVINCAFSDVTSVVFVSHINLAANLGRLAIAFISPGVSFTILSNNGNDNSQVAWFMIVTGDSIAGLTAYIPQMNINANALTYGFANLAGGSVTIQTPYAYLNPIIIVSFINANNNFLPNSNFYVNGVLDSVSFTISSTNNNDDSTVSYLLINRFPLTTPIANTTIGHPFLENSVASPNYGLIPLTSGTATEATTRAVLDDLYLAGTHRQATNPNNTGLYNIAVVNGVQVSFSSTTGAADDSIVSWWIARSTQSGI